MTRQEWLQATADVEVKFLAGEITEEQFREVSRTLDRDDATIELILVELKKKLAEES